MVIGTRETGLEAIRRTILGGLNTAMHRVYVCFRTGARWLFGRMNAGLNVVCWAGIGVVWVVEWLVGSILYKGEVDERLDLV